MDEIKKWISEAPSGALQAKLVEYENAKHSWNGRDNETISKLIVRIRAELERRART